MSNRIGFALATGLLLLAAVLRLWNLTTLPPGLNDNEFTNIRITESVRAGNIAVFYNLEALGDDGGREGLYHTALAATTTVTGSGLIGYRLLSVMFNILTLALVFALTTRLYGPWAGVAALALLALGMWPILLARTIGPETMVPFLVAAVMLAIARALPVHYQPSLREPGTGLFAALGLLLGLGFYVHPTHFVITLGSMVFIAYMVLSPQPLSRRTLSYIGFAVLVMIIVAMPYLLSSIRLPALDGAGRVFGDYQIVDKPPLQSIIDSLIGIFFIGDSNPAQNLPHRPLFDLVSGVIVIVGLLAAFRRWQRPRFLLPVVMLGALAPVAFLNNNSPNFNAFSGLLPVIAVLFGLGVATLQNSLRAGLRPAFTLGLLLLFAFNLVWTLNDLFQIWPRQQPTYAAYNGRIGQLAHHIDRTANDLPIVVCTPTVSAFKPHPTLSDAQRLLLMMHNKGNTIRYADCGTGLVLANGGDTQQVVLPGQDMMTDVHPYLRNWLEMGTMVADDTVPEGSVIVMDVADALADKIGAFTTTAPLRLAPEAPGGAEIVLPPVSFGGNLTFLGYEAESASNYQSGDVLTSIGYWRVDGMPPPDTRLFTHISSDPATVTAQSDIISVLASHLHPRDIFIQITFVELPSETPVGDYEISIGAYQESDNMRMSVLDGDQARGNRLFLSSNGFTVLRSE